MKGHDGLSVSFTYYLNPTANDRNIECGGNLVKDLEWHEKVLWP